MANTNFNNEDQYEYAYINSINSVNRDVNNDDSGKYIEIYDFENNVITKKHEFNNILGLLDRKVNNLFTIYISLLKGNKKFLIINSIGFALYFAIIYILITRF